MFRPGISGPQTPVLFLGHFGANNHEAKDFEEIVYEIDLSGNCILEGIHVVPNRISLEPSLHIQGMTIPEISVGSFHMQMYGQGYTGKDDILIFDLRVEGGVQWMPVPLNMQGREWERLTICGDFQILTIIIHGQRSHVLKVDTAEFAESSQNFSSSAKIENASIAPLILRDFDSSQKIKNVMFSDPMCVVSPAVLTAMRPFGTSGALILKNFDEATIHQGNMQSLSESAHIYFSTCAVSIDSVATLVEKIFSIDLGALDEFTATKLLETFSDLSSTLQICWKVISK